MPRICTICQEPLHGDPQAVDLCDEHTPTYPYPSDCPACQGKRPCAEHAHLAEGDNQGDRAHKGA